MQVLYKQKGWFAGGWNWRDILRNINSMEYLVNSLIYLRYINKKKIVV